MPHEHTIDDLRQNLSTVIKKGDGDVVKIDMNRVFDRVEKGLKEEEYSNVVRFLSELKVGISNLAYDYEKKYRMKEDAFRKWKGDLNALLTSKGDNNPLKQKNRKTTNKAIKAELRSRDKYKEYKDEITNLETHKNALWTSKSVIEDLLDFVKIKMKTAKNV